MTCVEYILDRARDFGIEEVDIINCISSAAVAFKTNEADICDIIKRYIQRIEYECIKRAELRGKKPKDYQITAVNHIARKRGLIAAFEVGTGKTLTAVISIRCVDQIGQLFGKNIKFIIVTPATLLDNFTREMTWYGLDINDSKYVFYTKEMFGIEYQKGNIDCKNTFLIIDEAHDFRTDYRLEFSGLKYMKDQVNAMREDGKLQRAESGVKCAKLAWKVMLLTGTPMYNREYDIVNLVAMVRGQDPIEKLQWEQVIKNDEYFDKYFDCTIIYQKAGDEYYPSRTDKLVKIEMTDEYYKLYRAEELKIRKSKKIDKKLALGDKDVDKLNDKNVSNAFMIALRKATNNLQDISNPHDRVSMCLKCDFTLNVIREGKKTLIHSSLVSSGIDIIEQALKKEGIPFLEISGRISKNKRSEIIKEYVESDTVNVLFITAAGEMGLDLKKVRYVILLEKGYNMKKEEQAVGRARRYKSHDGLPEDERNVTVYHLITAKPSWVKDFVNRKPEFRTQKSRLSTKYMLEIMSADEYLYSYSRNKQVNINKIEDRVKMIDIKHNPC